MLGITRHEARTIAAAGFVRSFSTNNSGTGDTANDNHLYAMIGRETDPQGLDNAGVAFPVGSGQWPAELLPPAPTKHLEEFDNFWNMVIAAKRIVPTDISLVIPRLDWTNGNTYIPHAKNTDTFFSDSAVVITDLNEVWMCCTAGAGISTVKPVRTNLLTADVAFIRDNRLGILTTADGYVWRYLWTLTISQSSRLSDRWVPVPLGESAWTPEADPQRTQGPVEPHAVVYARHVYIAVKLESGADGSNMMPADLTYRQIAFVKNPLTNSYARATANIYYQKNTINGASTDFLMKKTGNMIYLKNRSPVTREISNSEFVETWRTF